MSKRKELVVSCIIDIVGRIAINLINYFADAKIEAIRNSKHN